MSAAIKFESPTATKYSEKQQTNEQLHQEFLRAIEQRQPLVSSSSSCQYHNMEDLQPISSQDLKDLMTRLSTEQLLLIDVRSFQYYSKSRIQDSIHISIPSILLKRPSYTLEKVCEGESRAKLLDHWQDALYIIFYDHSSYKPSDSSNNSTCILLGSKLRNRGYKEQLNYLEGGFNEFFELFPDLCDTTNHQKQQQQQCDLPLPTSIPILSNQNNPFFSNIRQNLELAHGPLKERFDIRLPFGLHYEQGVIKSKINSPPYSQSHPRYGLAGTFLDNQGNLILPLWLNQVLGLNLGPKKLAELYEKLERTEQTRLSTVMKHHSASQQDEFPFSITSSIEKGALNRYDNIWPYEYSRVKLHENNYINANHVQFSSIKENITASPLQKTTQQLKLEDQGLLSEASLRTMTKKRTQDLASTRPYICTQGPLPTTFADFWKMIWDEQVPVIVMLTQEFELNKIKCHRYWPEESEYYGSIQVTFLSETKHTIPHLNDGKRHRQEEDVIIIRKFKVASSDKEERTVTHLQYPSWTDFGVPDLPTGLLELVHYADEAYYHQKQQQGPMVVHCSAGCGRSGTFCVIDTMIQRLWHERDVYNTTSMNDDKIFETISRFREQRMSMVQTHRQFVFCYEVIIWWLLGYGHLPVSSPMNCDEILL